MKKEMLINVRQSEECRIAIIEDGLLEELYVDRTSHETFSGNIYKGRIVNLEPAIQAAFVDFSIGRNGFLHVSDVEPRYYRNQLGDDVQLGGRDRGRDPRRVVASEDRPASAVEPRPAYGERSSRPPRPDRGGRRFRDDRRGGQPRQEFSPVTPSYDETARGYGASPALPVDMQGASESVVDLSSTEMSTQRGPRPDARRDRSRRGGASSRDRAGRGPRDRGRETRPEEESLRETPQSAEEFDYVDPFSEGGQSFRPTTSEALEDSAEPVSFDTSKATPSFFAEKPEPTVIEPSGIIPPPVVNPPAAPPARASFVTRVRRAFGSGLEDWETTESTPTSKVRPVLTPLPPSVAKPASAPIQEPKAEEPPTSSITRSMPPASSPPPPASPEPLPEFTPVPPAPVTRRSRFGSGLLEEIEDPTVPTKPVPEARWPVAQPELPETSIPSFTASRTEEKPLDFDRPSHRNSGRASIRESVPPVEPSFESRQESEAAESWSQYTPTETPPEAEDTGFDSPSDRPGQGRGRRRSGPAGRGRPRRSSGEPDRASEIPIEASESEAIDTGKAPVSDDFGDHFEESRIPRGRDAIRARGGNRESRGPRPPQDLRELGPDPIVSEPVPQDRPAARGGPGRYVPRLERERLRTPGSGPRHPFTDTDQDRMVPNTEFDSLTGDSEFEDTGKDGGFDPALGEDPRLQPRGRAQQGRRRRRRRRPAGLEPTGAIDSSREPVELDSVRPGTVDSADESESWAELDWSASPPGAAEALAQTDLSEGDDSELEIAPEPSRPRGRQKRRVRRGRPSSESERGSAHDDLSDDSDDDFLEPSGRSYAIDPTDIVEPELEEEIRREAEEIAVLEIELGIRMPGEIRESPRSGGAPGGRSAGGGRGFFKPPIQEFFHRNDEVLVQVIKESLGTKGPTLSTYISIPGRYLVLMPGLNRVGVSRKIADEGQRRKLRDLMNQLNPPKGLGFIVRTAGVDRTKRELARDLAYLLRLWKTILRRIKRTKSPAPIYQESDMIIRTIRDIFNSEIDTIWIDEPSAYERAHEFLVNVMPKFVDRLKFYDDKTPLFHKYGIEDEIAKIGMRHVPLPDGGSIVIDQTEALVAIDVNSGNFRVEDDAERTAYEMNLRAAKEIARQLRLRDLGGVIVNDFIDMREERHRRGVERALRDAIRRDRARTKILRMSQFGLIEMTRQRIRPSIKRSIYEDCQHCNGQGVVKTPESMSIDVMRILALAANRNDIRRINITCSHSVANYLNNRKRQDLARLERDGQMSVHIRPEDHAPAEFLQIDGLGNYNTEFRLYPTAAMTSNRRMPNTTSNSPSLPYTPSGQGGHHGQFH